MDATIKTEKDIHSFYVEDDNLRDENICEDKPDIMNHAINGQRDVSNTYDSEGVGVKQESTSETFSCVYCTFSSDALAVFIQHVESEHINESKPNREDSTVSSAADSPECEGGNITEYQGQDCNVLKQETPKRELGEYQCVKCDFSAEQKASLIRHMEFKHDMLAYKCEHCDYSTTSKMYFTRHLRNKHRQKKQAYECGCCDQTCRYLLLKHVTFSRDNGVKSRKYKSLNSSKPVRQRNKFANDKFRCGRCDYTTGWMYSLYRHIRNLHSEQHETYTCDLCRYTTKIQTEFKQHVSLEHGTQSRVYACRRCTYLTNSMTSLDMHRRAAHAKLHECKVCDYAASKNCDLIRHLLTHDAAAPTYKCKYCSLTTKHLEYLPKHMRLQHAEVLKAPQHHVEAVKCAQEYRCDFCDRLCKTRHVLALHMKISHNVTAQEEIHAQCGSENVIQVGISKSARMLLECGFCDYTTRWKHTLASHVRSTHNRRSWLSNYDRTARVQTIVPQNLQNKHNTSGQSYKCDYKECRQILESTQLLSEHMTDAHAKLYKPTDCRYTAMEVDQSLAHVEAQGDTVTAEYKCEPFDAELVTVSDHHTELNQVETYKCEGHNYKHGKDTTECETAVSNLKRRKKHVARNYECGHCGGIHDSKTSLLMHIKAVHTIYKDGLVNETDYSTNIDKNDSANEYNCRLCSFKTNSHYFLAKHEEDAHSKNYTTYKDDHCDYTTKDEAELAEHAKGEHPAEQQSGECSQMLSSSNQCLVDNTTKNKGKALGQLKAQHDHMALKYDRELRPRRTQSKSQTIQIVRNTYARKCKHGSFKDANSCKDNVKTGMHSNNKCKTNFSLKASRRVTRKTIPYGKLHKCKTCSYTTDRKYDMTRHIVTRHDASAPKYKCEHCKWFTKWRTYLAAHLKAMHPQSYKATQIKKDELEPSRKQCNNAIVTYKCERCGWVCGTQRLLSKHMETVHSNGKLLQCPICDYSSYSKSHLINHATEAHILATKQVTDLTCRTKDDTVNRLGSCIIESVCEEEEDSPKHPRSTHGCDVVENMCPLCEYTTDDETAFKEHIRKHMSQ